jgi:hypothetical protein
MSSRRLRWVGPPGLPGYTEQPGIGVAAADRPRAKRMGVPRRQCARAAFPCAPSSRNSAAVVRLPRHAWSRPRRRDPVGALHGAAPFVRRRSRAWRDGRSPAPPACWAKGLAVCESDASEENSPFARLGWGSIRRKKVLGRRGSPQLSPRRHGRRRLISPRRSIGRQRLTPRSWPVPWWQTWKTYLLCLGETD